MKRWRYVMPLKSHRKKRKGHLPSNSLVTDVLEDQQQTSLAVLEQQGRVKDQSIPVDTAKHEGDSHRGHSEEVIKRLVPKRRKCAFKHDGQNKG